MIKNNIYWIIMGFDGILKKAFNSVWLKKRNFDPEKLDIDDIKLPDLIMKYSQTAILQMIKDELKTFTFLNYKGKTKETLQHFTYHSFQIGILLRAIQLDLDILVHNAQNVFPQSVMELSTSVLDTKVFDIVKKYNKSVSKILIQSQLEADIAWTPLEAAYLLYYLAINKK